MLPRVILHTGVSADGRIDWFSPDVGLYYELAGRWETGCMLAGSDTLLAASDKIPPEDEAAPQRAASQRAANQSAAFDPDDPRPILAVPDSRGRLAGTWHYWRSLPYWKHCVALVSEATPAAYLDHLNRRGVDAIVAGAEQVEFRAALEELNDRYDVTAVRVDSGGTLNGVLLRAGLVDEVSLLVHPALVGGTSAKSSFRGSDLTSSDGVIPLKLLAAETMRDGIVWLRYEVVH